jgi:hypothetical protein
LLAIIGAMLHVAGAARAEVAIPVVGRPTPFYEAAGRNVTIEATASPVDLTLDDTITFTLTIRNLLNPAEVQRPNLSEIKAFREGFQIDDEAGDTTGSPGTRVFRYKLRPRGVTVTEIPRVVFPYYDPDKPQPPDRPSLPFRKAETQPIPLRIKKTAPPPLDPVPVTVPDFAATLAESSSAELPALGWWLAAVGPPSMALAAYVAWRIVNPEGARLARRRRSRAARAALRTLHGLARHPPVDLTRVVGCVAEYVAERFDLPGVFRTPGDVAKRLREVNAPEPLVHECEDFFRETDVARFAPAYLSADELIADAERLVRRLEGDE